jgi:hypothetical protein
LRIEIKKLRNKKNRIKNEKNSKLPSKLIRPVYPVMNGARSVFQRNYFEMLTVRMRLIARHEN